MVLIRTVTEFLEKIAPPILAEKWDNVGLLVGDESRETAAVMTCLTLTHDVAEEAIRRDAQLVVSHHPVLFRPVQQLTGATSEGLMLLELMRAGIAVYSPHTSYDSAHDGVNQQLAVLLDLNEIAVLRPLAANSDDGEDITGTERFGAGRYGRLRSAMTLSELNQRVKAQLGIEYLQYVGERSARIDRVGIACGSAAEFMHDAREKGCQALLTGEARFHACLEAQSLGISLVLAGHYATERPAMERLQEMLADKFPTLEVWASEQESDPLRWE
jgi:dinuclear metal center YbgI/SA1388 family protein